MRIILILMTLFTTSIFANRMGPSEKLWFPVGLNFSYCQGFQMGGEMSLVHFTGDWYGLYTDAVYNLKQENWKFSFGPEIGFAYFGSDFGLILTEKNHETKTGITGRLLLSFVGAHAYIRLNYLFKDETSFEAGILLKFPIPVN